MLRPALKFLELIEDAQMETITAMLAVALTVSIAASIIGWALRDRSLPDVEENPWGNPDIDNLPELMRQDRG